MWLDSSRLSGLQSNEGQEEILQADF